jgi:hypothetical protein
MGDGQGMTFAAKLVAAAAVCVTLSFGLCFGGLVLSHGSSTIMADGFMGGLGLLALAVVLGVAAFVVFVIEVSKGPR